MAQRVVNVLAAAAFGVAASRWVIDLKQRKAIPVKLSLRADGAAPPQTEATKAWLLVIQSRFQSIEDRDALISHVRGVAVESAQKEPNTLGFQIAIADNDPLKILIFERFVSKADCMGPHKEGEAYKELKKWQASSGIEVETAGQSYDETEIGFLTPSERALLTAQGAS